MIKLLPPGMHVVLGDSAGGIFTRVYFARDRLLIDQDVLSCGPTPPCTDLAEWNTVRGEFWTGLVPASAEEHEHSRFNLVDNARRLAEAERVYVWAATGVSEQLFVAFVVQLMRLVGGNPTNIALVQFETVDKRRVVGLGELDEEQLRAAPDPVQLSVDSAQMYLSAWHALTSPDPQKLAGFARDHQPANRWLKLAMQLMTRRFPDRRNGLSYWDHALLSRIEKFGPEVSRIIGFTMAETFEQGDLVGDWYLFGRMLRMCSVANAQPLIVLSGDGMSLRTTHAVLTPFGKEVLAGAVSNYPTNPIEEWAAGTRLSSAAGSLWFNDGGRLVKG